LGKGIFRITAVVAFIAAWLGKVPWIELLASIIVKSSEKVVDKAIVRGFPVLKARHRKQLSVSLRKMPFVYKDLALDIVTDFVDIDVSAADPYTFKYKTGVKGDDAPIFEKLRRHKRIVLIGEAGIGKTTLCRFAIQSILVDCNG
jgi:hypothetical protein